MSRANDKQIAVKVSSLTKTFRVPVESHSGIKQKLINTLKGVRGYRDFTPLNDVSFTIQKGEFFGIVGRNGSGKSTLLKSIAGIYSPTSGGVQVDGKLVPFIELGVGFNPELTGRENVFLNGAMLGFSNDEMEAMYDEIVDFAELHDFMDERLKNYSSGMQVRLAFSIAIRAEGDILLLDEVLAVGDEAFQQKCYDYFDQIKRDKKTVILVTHSMEVVKRYCTRALYLKDGSTEKIGSPSEVANYYSIDNFSAGEKSTAKDDGRKASKVIGGKLKSIKSEIKNKKKLYSPQDVLEVDFMYTLLEDEDIIIKFALEREGSAIAHINSLKTYEGSRSAGSHKVMMKLKLDNLLDGTYGFTWGVFNSVTHKKLAMQYDADRFLVINDDETRSGYFKLEASWSKGNDTE